MYIKNNLMKNLVKSLRMNIYKLSEIQYNIKNTVCKVMAQC